MRKALFVKKLEGIALKLTKEIINVPSKKKLHATKNIHWNAPF